MSEVTNAGDSKSVTIVGIGASAGGLGALKTFFSLVPKDSGVIYVVVVHLSPEHKSILSELIQPHSKIPVQQVNSTLKMEPNNAYVIPPGAHLNTIDTHLRLSELEKERSQRNPIDHFFRTLSKTHDGDSIGVILTGTGSDGALGIKEIKEHNGLILVQDPNEAEYDGMPQSAIATGMVDLVLPIREIPGHILHLAQNKPHLKVTEDIKELGDDEKGIMQKLFAQIRARTGRDFSRYKTSTIIRRLQRRMNLFQVMHLKDYLDIIKKNPSEINSLSDDFLITVTSFFRDPKVHDHLKKDVIPQLFKDKNHNNQIRVWSIGCATGEEAYSLSMLMHEEAEKHTNPPEIQLFASDLHEHSLQKAREGFYHGEIDQDVGPARLRKFFIKEDSGYRIRKELRESIIFTPHNLLSDPPFSKLNLIVCRNLLIYLKRDIQKDVIELFHYALQPSGYLLFGNSEHMDQHDLFKTINKQYSIFLKRNVVGPEPKLPVFPLKAFRFSEEMQNEELIEQVSYNTLHQRMLQKYTAPSILISPEYHILHISENAGRYLKFPGGEPTINLFKILREELRIELRAGLHSAREKNKMIRSKPVLLKIEGEMKELVMSINIGEDKQLDRIGLIIFEENDVIVNTKQETGSIDSASIQELEAELNINQQRLQSIIEEYETTQEEMKASNEELQSANEELRSTMEELETSKEELQSLNEELTTVNQENRHKVDELGQLSSDLQNLLASTEIATLFLDRDLKILRFTPRVGELFSVRMSDRGRLIADITHRLGYKDLIKDAQRVLDKLVPIEGEVEDESGNWFITKILPYRSAEDRIEGVVLTFVDITSRKKIENSLRKREEQLRKMIDVDGVCILIFDSEGVLTEANYAFQKMFGYDQRDIDSRSITWKKLTPEAYLKESEMHLEKLNKTGKVSPYQKEYFRKDGSKSWMLFASAPLENRKIIEYAIDINSQKLAENELKNAKEFSENVIETLQDPLLVLTQDLKVKNANPAFYKHFKVQKEETVGQLLFDLGNGQWNIETLRTQLIKVLPENERIDGFEVDHHFENLGRRIMRINARRIDHLQLVLLDIMDITKQKAYESELKSTDRQFKNLTDQLPDILWSAKPDGTGNWYNQQWEQITGQSDQEARNFGWLEMIHTDDRDPLLEKLKKASKTGEALRWAYRIQRHDGVFRWYLGQLRPFTKKNGDIQEWLGIATDAHFEILSNEMKQNLLFLTAHDLRSPLSTLNLMIQLLEKNQDDVDQHLPRVKTLAQRMEKVLNGLTDIIEAQSSLEELKVEEVDFGEVIDQVKKDLHNQLEANDSNLTTIFQGGLSFYYKKQILINILKSLVSNSIRFRSDQRLLEVEIEAVQKEHLIVIKVKDNGIGIDIPQIRNHLFRPFKQFSQINGGHGTGLYLVKNLVEINGGEIEIESEVGNGTTVICSLREYVI